MSKLEMTVKKAESLRCPFLVTKMCSTDKCMAWVDVTKKKTQTEVWTYWDEAKQKMIGKLNRKLQDAVRFQGFGNQPTEEQIETYRANKAAWLEKFPEPAKYVEDPENDTGYCARMGK